MYTTIVTFHYFQQLCAISIMRLVIFVYDSLLSPLPASYSGRVGTGKEGHKTKQTCVMSATFVARTEITFNLINIDKFLVITTFYDFLLIASFFESNFSELFKRFLRIISSMINAYSFCKSLTISISIFKIANKKLLKLVSTLKLFNLS